MQYVYVLRSSSGMSKVGVSSTPEKRCSAITTGSGFKTEIFKLFGPFNSAGKVESFAKRTLSPARAYGEWFRCAPEDVVSVIEKYLDSFVDDKPCTGISPDDFASLVFCGEGTTAKMAIDFAESVLGRYRKLVVDYAELEEKFSDAVAMIEYYASLQKPF